MCESMLSPVASVQVPRELAESLQGHVNALKQAGPVDYHPHSNGVVPTMIAADLCCVAHPAAS